MHVRGIVRDFHITLLWLRALEAAAGYALPGHDLTDLEMSDLFARFRSPWKA